MVVDDIGKMVGWKIVRRLIEHLIVKNRRVDHHFAAHKVVDFYVTVWLDKETHHVLFSAVNHALHIFGRQRQRVAHLHAGVRVVLEILDFRTLRLQFLRSVESHISLAVVKQLLDILPIDVAALRLAVGTEIAALADSFVKFYSQPGECLVYIIFRSRHKAIGVGIFDAKYDVAAMTAGKQVVEQCRADSSNVERTRWRRCKAYSDFSFHFADC